MLIVHARHVIMVAYIALMRLLEKASAFSFCVALAAVLSVPLTPYKTMILPRWWKMAGRREQ